MGTVYLARSPGARLAALKLIRRDLAADPVFRERFRREIAAAALVSGLYTAPVLDADADGPQPWFAAAYVPAPTLYEGVAAIGAMPEPAVRALGAGLAEALQAVHGAGLVHRDLNPGNVLLAEDGPRIIDFGIAKVTDATRLTGTEGMLGTLAFMAPEQIADGEQAGPAADMFSLAGVLVYAATGGLPFGEEDPTTLLYQVMYDDPGLDGVPAPLRELLAACLDKNPARRPGPSAVLAALTPADPRALISPALRREVAAREAEAHRISSAPVVAPPPLPRVDDPDANALRRRRFLGLAAAAVAVTGAAGGTAAWALTRTPGKAAKPAPHTTALATAPPPTWTFDPPGTLTDETVVRVTAGVVVFGTFGTMYALDARSGRRLWSQGFSLSSGSIVHGSTFVAPGGGPGRLLTLIDAPTGKATVLPGDDDVLATSVFGVAGDTAILELTNSRLTSASVVAVDLSAGGKVRWRRPADSTNVSGAIDQTSVYVNNEGTLTALDLATGRERWAHTWSKGAGSSASMNFAVAGGRVFGNFGDQLQAIDTVSGKPAWSRHTANAFDAYLADTNVIFKGDDLRAYDQGTGAARWTLAGPVPFSSVGPCTVADGTIAAAFGGFSGYAQGILVAGADGRARFARWGAASGNEDWDAAIAGASVFATDHQRLYCLPAGS
jgi:outer membrane protein assembly factor BamB